jgi:hypothetical protein
LINQGFFKVARINEKHGGARKGAGRKPKADEQDALDLMNAAWPAERRAKAVRAMATAAEKGNVKAFSALMAYAFGKPTEHKIVESRTPEQVAEYARERLREVLAEHPGLTKKERAELIKYVAVKAGVDEAELVM